MWGLVRDAPSLVRFGPMGGIVGLDWPGLLAAAAAMGIPQDAVAGLLPAIETGMVMALADEAPSGRDD